MRFSKPKKTKPKTQDSKDYYVTLVVDTPASADDYLVRQGFSYEGGKLVYTPPKKPSTT
ncbi:MAG: hypothetical protein JO218_13765 [Burkholderiales bacterium]|nr:hypothetical protein [Burkholderiales bacterium]